jgi:hypothetical protein
MNSCLFTVHVGKKKKRPKIVKYNYFTSFRASTGDALSPQYR